MVRRGFLTAALVLVAGAFAPVIPAAAAADPAARPPVHAAFASDRRLAVVRDRQQARRVAPSQLGNRVLAVCAHDPQTPGIVGCPILATSFVASIL